jgi:uncharacterized protein YlxP (DUF503 family)
MFVLLLDVEIHIPAAHSLKAKRAVVKSLVEGGRQRFQVASAEVGYQDKWQRSRLGFAAVASSASHVTEVIDEVERFVWSSTESDVVRCERRWMDDET